MPMNTPAFTTNPERIARLQYNYDAGLSREQIPTEQRERMDLELLDVSPTYVRQLFMNVEAIKAKRAAEKEAEIAARKKK